MDILFVPGAMRFSAHIDEAVEGALRRTGHRVRTVCRDCVATIGQGALAEVRADLLLTIHGRRFPHPVLKQAPHVRAKAVWLLDEPQEIDLSERYARHFDIVLTNDRNTCGVHGPHKTWYLPLAADPEVHRPNGQEAQYDLAFVGGILPERALLLDQAYQLASDFNWLIVGPDRWGKPVSFQPVWQNRAVNHQEYVDLIRSARIVLDIPRDGTVSFAGRTNKRGIPATGVGCRPFEVTACGRLLLTDDSRADLAGLFPEGTVAQYRAGDAADLVNQARYWREHDEEREEAAELGREWCLREHTYAARVRQIVDIVEAWLGTRLVPAAGARATRGKAPGGAGLAGGKKQ